jgi:hypothetical protein
MNILQIVSAADVNGAVIHCLQLCRALAVRGHHVTLLCRTNAWIKDQLTGLGDAAIRVVESIWTAGPQRTAAYRAAGSRRVGDRRDSHPHDAGAPFWRVFAPDDGHSRSGDGARAARPTALALSRSGDFGFRGDAPLAPNA